MIDHDHLEALFQALTVGLAAGAGVLAALVGLVHLVRYLEALPW